MRRLAASVCIVTTLNEDGSRNGLTAEPPTLLCCLKLTSNSYLAIEKAGAFAVNVLSADDQAIADHFSSTLPGSEKFGLGVWTSLITGAPILESAITVFDCKLTQVVAVATHAILLGEVQALNLHPDGPKPLLYVDGAYGAFAHHEMLTTKAL
jgi:flavin reductase (DIM6/NTAB) family NADH-FMN oxidoreductase RutF